MKKKKLVGEAFNLSILLENCFLSPPPQIKTINVIGLEQERDPILTAKHRELYCRPFLRFRHQWVYEQPVQEQCNLRKSCGKLSL